MTGWTLVTGGARRVGRAICLELAKQGHHVLIHYHHSEKEALETADQCRSFGVDSATIQGNLADPDQVHLLTQKIKEQYPDIHYFVNNVGNYLIKSALKTEDAEWRSLFETNLHAPYLLIKAFQGSIIEGKGRIINIGVSGLNRAAADTYSTVYTLTKQGLLHLTKSLAKELAPKGVTVNMISPGHLENSVDLPQDQTKLPMQRPVALDEVANLVAFLFNPKNRSITGQNIEVAGAVRL